MKKKFKTLEKNFGGAHHLKAITHSVYCAASAVRCGDGTAAVDNTCVIQFGSPKVIEQPYACEHCGYGQAWKGSLVDMQSYLETHHNMPSKFEVHTGPDCRD